MRICHGSPRSLFPAIEAAAEYGCSVHAYVLMTNHVHLLVTPGDAESLPRTMQSLGRRYVRHVNRLYGRTGTLWEGRYRAAPIRAQETLPGTVPAPARGKLPG